MKGLVLAKFYVVCQPGFEKELIQEIHEFWPYLINKEGRPHCEQLNIQSVDVGGLLIDCSQILGYQINFFSKIATRVLERVSEFKVRDFPKMLDRFQKINWNSYFESAQMTLKIAASQSRLNNEKRIQEIAEKCWSRHLSVGKTSLSTMVNFEVMIRMFDDLCTVSLDTSGGHLHFRAYNQTSSIQKISDPESSEKRSEKRVGDAPLRETCASFIIRKMIESETQADLHKINLVDPMAGSGTILNEAAMLYQPNLNRTYAFQFFKSAPKILSSPQLIFNYPEFPFLFSELIAIDKNEKVIQILKFNFENIYLRQKFLKEKFRVPKVQIFQKDLLSKPLEPIKGPFWIVTNPPYGERLEGISIPKMAKTLAEMGAEKVGVLLPPHHFKDLNSGFEARYQLAERCAFKNGGLPVEFYVYRLVNLR